MRPYWAVILTRMSGVWCRFCGGFGLADRMVCSAKVCMAKDLAMDLAPFDFDQAIGPSGSSITVAHKVSPASSHSLHAYAVAFDASTRSVNQIFQNINIT